MAETAKPNGIRKLLLAVAAALVLGTAGALVAWGAMGASQKSDERRLAVIESIQLTDGRAVAGLATQITQLQASQASMRSELQASQAALKTELRQDLRELKRDLLMAIRRRGQ